MTPQEKARELFDKYHDITPNEAWFNEPTTIAYSYDAMKLAKQCALIAVDEIIEQWDYIDTYLADLRGELNPNLKYWQEVKVELENKY